MDERQKSTIRALILEDSPTDAELTVHELKRKFVVEWLRADKAAQMREALDRSEWDIVIADYHMPQFTVLDALEILRSTGTDLPLIVVSGKVGEDTAVEAMRAGAVDYMLKDNLTRLCPAVEREIREARRRRKRIEAEASLQEARSVIEDLALFPRENPNPVLRVSTEGKIRYANDPAAALLNAWGCRIESSLPGWIREHVTRVHGNGASEQIECNAGDRILAFTLAPAGGKEYVNLYGHDITGRKRAEETVRESERKLKSIIQNMPVLLDAFDDAGKIIAWNHECERVTGYGAAEIIGNPAAVELLYPDREYRENLFSEWAARGDSFRNLETTLTARDGQERHVLWSNISAEFPIPGWRSWSIGVDVTEFRDLESRLRQSQKLQAIGQLAGGIAHDLNNSLGGISGYADLLKMQCESSPGVVKYADKILTSVTGASGLIKKLLTFARRRRIDMVPTDVHEVIRQAVEILRHTIDRRIEIRMRLCDGTVTVNADPDQISSMILNLGVNARDAMAEGGTLDIHTGVVTLDPTGRPGEECDLPAGEYLCISVSDTGTGMDPETRKRIFDPFFTTKETGKGTGLGLATVYGAVQQHHGRITVDSRTGKGTTFRIYLPLLGEAPPEERDRSRHAVPGKGGILLVDDEEAILETTSEMLRMLGYRVWCCADGEQAAEHYTLNHDRIDAVILDMIMPRLNGLECMRRLKAVDPGVAVVVASGYGDTRAETAIMNEGAGKFIRKPFQASELSEALAEVLREKAS